MKSLAVIGALFGDEGKGSIVDRLCAKAINPLVIRFCGGHQAGHHVVINDELDHVFSNFGSGTLRGFDTYWSPFCTVDPVGLLNELDNLLKLPLEDLTPKIYIDAKCPITTPLDKKSNVHRDAVRGHGTCGVGFGETLRREENRCSLLFSDLFTPSVLSIKCDMITQYYGYEFPMYGSDVDDFFESCRALTRTSNVEMVYDFPAGDYTEYIFEGAQGLGPKTY
jgi:adenylosuccinate synthase